MSILSESVRVCKMFPLLTCHQLDLNHLSHIGIRKVDEQSLKQKVDENWICRNT